MNELIYIGIFFSQLGLKGLGDWWYKKYKKKIINHELSLLIDGTIYLVAGWFLVGFDTGFWLFILAGSRWLFYDLLYNWINNEKWNHYGKSDRFDRFSTKMGKWHLAPKIGLILLGIILIIVL